jgi:hypothetical protein
MARADLEFSDLRNADLNGADLEGANLRGADLSFASLVNARLPGANLFGANLVGAKLTGATLTDASFVDASLQRANLEGSAVAGARWSGATYDFLTDWPSNLEVNRCSPFEPACRLPSSNWVQLFQRLIIRELPTWKVSYSKGGFLSIEDPGSAAYFDATVDPHSENSALTLARFWGRFNRTFKHYRELSFEPVSVLGGGFGFVRLYTYVNPKSFENRPFVVTVMELYYVEGGREYVLSASAFGQDFVKYEPAFSRVFSALTD